MKKKNILWGILILCLFLALPVSAAGTTGWKTTASGKKYYYVNGRIVKSKFVVIKGKTSYFNRYGTQVKRMWFFLNGRKYRANRYGTILKNGLFSVDGKTYYMRADGSVYKGWKTFAVGKRYFGKDGAMAKGATAINGKTYYFSSRGVLQTGIQTVKNTTYFLADNGTVEAKRVASNGKTTYYNAAGKKLDSVLAKDYETYLRARKVVNQITNSGMTKAQKLRKCFDWVMAKPYATHRKFSNYSGWVSDFANDHFVRGSGNCQSDACAFAYMAKVIGYKNIYVCTDSEGAGLPHSWTEINGLVYDPLFAESKGVSRYYGCSYKAYGLYPIVHVPL